MTATHTVAQYAYDCYGHRRSHDRWDRMEVQDVQTAFDRGYCMHEHLAMFGLIDMDGRVFNPHLNQFISPDPNIQDPTKWLNYNRYAYGLQNPVMYNDPTGEFWHIVIGAAIGGILNWATHGCQFNGQGLGYFAVGAAAGAATAAVGAGMGACLSGTGSFAAGVAGTATCTATGFVAGAAVGAATGAIGGFMTGMGNALVEGGNFYDGFRAGFISGLTGAASGALIGGVISGIAAVCKGNDFWNGRETLSIDEIIDRNHPYVHNESGTDCSLDCCESLTDGEVKVEEWEKICEEAGIKKHENGYNSNRVFNEFSKKTGKEITAEGALSSKEIYEKVSQGYDVVGAQANVTRGETKPHVVVVNKVIKATVRTNKGRTFIEYRVKVMDPNSGKYVNTTSLKNCFIFR